MRFMIMLVLDLFIQNFHGQHECWNKNRWFLYISPTNSNISSVFFLLIICFHFLSYRRDKTDTNPYDYDFLIPYQLFLWIGKSESAYFIRIPPTCIPLKGFYMFSPKTENSKDKINRQRGRRKGFSVKIRSVWWVFLIYVDHACCPMRKNKELGQDKNEDGLEKDKQTHTEWLKQESKQRANRKKQKKKERS